MSAAERSSWFFWWWGEGRAGPWGVVPWAASWPLGAAVAAFCTWRLVWPMLRKRWKVRANCWFCGEDWRVSVEERHSGWTCPGCGQYNGFLASGEYNRELPEQHLEALNPRPVGGGSLPPADNGLCQDCNWQQQQLVQLVAALDSSDDEAEACWRRRKAALEEQHGGLCERCRSRVRLRVDAQDQWLRPRLLEWLICKSQAQPRTQTSPSSATHTPSQWTKSFAHPLLLMVMLILLLLVGRSWIFQWGWSLLLQQHEERLWGCMGVALFCAWLNWRWSLGLPRWLRLGSGAPLEANGGCESPKASTFSSCAAPSTLPSVFLSSWSPEGDSSRGSRLVEVKEEEGGRRAASVLDEQLDSLSLDGLSLGGSSSSSASHRSNHLAWHLGVKTAETVGQKEWKGLLRPSFLAATTTVAAADVSSSWRSFAPRPPSQMWTQGLVLLQGEGTEKVLRRPGDCCCCCLQAKSKTRSRRRRRSKERASTRSYREVLLLAAVVGNLLATCCLLWSSSRLPAAHAAS